MATKRQLKKQAQQEKQDINHRTFTYLEFSNKTEFKNVVQAFNWKDPFLRNFLRIEPYELRAYVYHNDELPTIIRILYQHNPSVRFTLHSNKPSVTAMLNVKDISGESESVDE